MATVSTNYSMYINFTVEFITNVTKCLDILDQNFGVTDTRKCGNLDDHFSQYALLILKHLSVLLICPMLWMSLPSMFERKN